MNKIEDDPLAGLPSNQPVEIEELERRREERRQKREDSRPRINITAPTVVIDYALVGAGLSIIGFLLYALAILTIPHLPGIFEPYTVAGKILLLAVAFVLAGIVLLRVAVASRRRSTMAVMLGGNSDSEQRLNSRPGR